MADAIANLSTTTGKTPLVFNLCEWGWVSPSIISVSVKSLTESSDVTLRAKCGFGGSKYLRVGG